VELAQELDIGIGFLVHPNPKPKPWKNIIENRGKFFKYTS
jgi:hypothetical protein